MVEEMEAYRKIIRENISYECFEDSRYRQQEEVDELVELMVEVMVMPDNSTVRIGGVDKPVVIVKNRFMKVEHGHIEYVVGCLEKNTSKVGNIRAYLLTTLYNSTMTIENYYRACLLYTSIKAEFKHGILKLFVPKKEAKPAVEEKKHIAIEG